MGVPVGCVLFAAHATQLHHRAGGAATALHGGKARDTQDSEVSYTPVRESPAGKPEESPGHPRFRSFLHARARFAD